MKINKHIEIVSSSESWLSSMSKISRDAVHAVLSKHYAKVGITLVNSCSDLVALTYTKPDLVFLGMKFVPMNHALGMEDPDKVWITKYLDEHDITYTGSNRIAHELELNKPLAKQRVIDAGLDTSRYIVAKQNSLLAREEISLRFPVFIKPTNRGGGQGVDANSLAHDFDQLSSKVQSITSEVRSDSLIEEYLPGREFSVAVLKNEHTGKYSVMPLERIVPADDQGVRILSVQAKHADAGRSVKVLDKNIKTQVIDLAISAFHALGARDYGRIDIRLDEAGTPHFLEANLIPSLIGGYGNFPKACVLNVNLNYEPMILNIVRLALARKVKVSKAIKKPVSIRNVILPSIETVFDSV